MGWFRRHKPEHNPEVKAAMEIRDELLVQADEAIREVDRVQGQIIEDYAEAEKQRLANGWHHR